MDALPKPKTKQKQSRVRPREKPLRTRSVDESTAKLITEITSEINKKSFGRKIRESEVIAAGVKLIGQPVIEKLRDSSLTEKDRVDLAFKLARQADPKLTYDQFLGRLLRGEISREVLAGAK